MADTPDSLDPDMVMSMRAMLDMVSIVLHGEQRDVPTALETWTAVHGTREVHVNMQPDGSLNLSELDALIRAYVGAGCHALRLLLAYVEERFGVPGVELLDGFERDLAEGDV